MAVFSGAARRASACLTAFVCMTQGAAFAQYPNPNYSYLPYPTPHPYAPAQPLPAPCEQPVPRLVPDDGFFYDSDAQIDLVIRETIRGTYMRLEYLGWDIQEPGNNLLGVNIAGVANPRDPFLVQTASGSVGVAESLSTDRVDFQEINGIRGTVGIPFEYGTLEGSFWGLAEGSHTIEDRPFLRDNSAVSPRFIAIGLMTNGQVGDRVLLFDQSFSADYSASAWGSDVNFLYAAKNPRLGLGFQPLAGFRFLNYDESLSMRGVFDNSSGAYTDFGIIADPYESRIRSEVNNNVYALQVGFKADFKHQFFSLAFEPKLAFGANDYSTRVTTNDLRSFDDPTLDPGPNDIDDPATNSTTGRTVFSPTIDLGFSAKVHLSEWFHVRAGYNFIWTGNLARADRAINYNDISIADPPAVTARQRTDSILIQGFSIGGEIILP
ncbi:hypothetical protein Pan44_33150 [Caulifigura coniformis]|uniref:Outer membrane protein beta-barrel domain-containing protein n=1 Tax=Caulifigura coniformis TaxID=2527983 RepID=A0A517SGM2_9PLAN|nr:BBP7 family outer membrane beta-barrel protein [Caulifigura coniformis]QDT55272.1 hypothetical protein Pan44_33150 [Caulifigura coniformis]